MDKNPMRYFLLKIFIFDNPPICAKTDDWGTRDPRRDVGFYRLGSPRMVLIKWAILGLFMWWARW